jgi:hypothetical protein
VLVPLLTIVPWKIWLATHDQPTSSPYYKFSNLAHPGYLANRAGRLERALSDLPQYLFAPHRWALVVPLALAAAARQATYGSDQAGVLNSLEGVADAHAPEYLVWRRNSCRALGACVRHHPGWFPVRRRSRARAIEVALRGSADARRLRILGPAIKVESYL